MDLSIIIVTWNSAPYIARCLRSLARAIPGRASEIIVIDNASSDGTADIIRTQFPSLHLIALSVNEGFARACNRGYARAQGRFLCFLNPDAEILDHALEVMMSFFTDHPRAWIVGGMLLHPDGSIQRTVRRFPRVRDAYGLAFKLHHIPVCKQLFTRYFYDSFDYTRTQRTEQVMGAFFMITHTAMDTLKGFDERYFIWFEEVDLMQRVVRAGGEVWYCPSARAQHAQARSFAQVDSMRNQVRFLTSLRLYVQKWYGSIVVLPLMVIQPFILLGYFVYDRLNSRLKGQISKPQLKTR